MSVKGNLKEIRGYCSQCSCWCPIVSIVRDNVFVDVKADKEHPLECGICPKALAGPELVYHKERLKYPLKRTNSKSDPDPGWGRISWDEALDTIAEKLNDIKKRFGPESIATARSGPSGSPMGELNAWITRFCNALGSPNSISTTHICQWHRDWGSSYTFGNIGRMHSAGRAEFENSACILIWGNNIHANRHALLASIKRGLNKGAKLIVIDPKKTEIAAMADIWLQVRPGTDGALALGMIDQMLQKNIYDHNFVENWTTAPFLVRSDNGQFLRPSDLGIGTDISNFVILDSVDGLPRECVPGAPFSVKPKLDGDETIQLPNGEKIECKTVYTLLCELTSDYPLDKVEKLTGISHAKIKAAAQMFAAGKPASWYAWNGIEQNINAMQTNRAVNILYALTGNYDAPGGNVILKGPASNPVFGHNLMDPTMAGKRLGFNERPLGPCSRSGSVTQAYEIYRAILTGKPYPIKAMIGFGGNIIMSNAPSKLAKKALAELDFHVQTELFLSPTAQLADIVLPAASSWECWHVGAVIAPLGDKGYVRLRPEVVPPQNECWSDMKIMFELAKRLGFGNHFWDGNVEACFDYQFSPSGITVADLKKNPGGICLDLDMQYRKYEKMNSEGNFTGFPSPSKRVEIYSTVFKDHGYDPLPSWTDPLSQPSDQVGSKEKFPLLLTSGKLVEYCHSQHRALPSLRKRVPHPYLGINPAKADELGIADGDWVLVETAFASITLKAQFSDGIANDVVCTQNGWWQGCTELNLPGYDPYSSEGANINLLFDTKERDPISGSLRLKGYPCNVRKAVKQST